MDSEHEYNETQPLSEDQTLDLSLGSVSAHTPDGPLPKVEGYRLINILGRGGMGTVYRAEQLGTQRQVAIKLMSSGSFATDKAKLRFEREVSLAARLDHPNIAGVYDSGLFHGIYYYAMELIEGWQLDQYVSDRQLDDRETLELMAKVCRAVQHAHQRGVIHRDLKPSNIFVTDDGHPHVLDFGLAKTLANDDSHVTLSQDGDIAGTPAYMAPEQAAGRVRDIDTRTDVYALGVILYKLLTGEPPHEVAGTRFELLRRIIEEDVRRPREVSVSIDGELEALLLKALEREPDRRYDTAGSLANDIDNYLTNEPLSAHAPTTFYFLKKRFHRYRVPIAIGAVFAITMIAIVTVGFFRERDLRIDAQKAEQRATDSATEARNAETAARQSATEARTAESKARDAERIAREAGETAKSEARAAKRSLYYSKIALAEQYRLAGDLDRANALLDECPRSLRLWEWYYMKGQCESMVLRFGAQGPYAWAPDGKTFIAVQGGFKSFTIRDSVSAREIRSIDSQGQRLSGAHHFDRSNPGQFVTYGSGRIRIWNLEGKLIHDMKAHPQIYSSAQTRDGKKIVTTGNDFTAKVWDVTNGSLIHSLRHKDQVISALLFNEDESQFSTSGRNEACVWNIETGELIKSGTNSYTLRKGFAPAHRPGSLSHDGKLKLSDQYAPGALKVINTTTDQPIGVFPGRTNVRISPDGRFVVSFGSDMMSDVRKVPSQHIGIDLVPDLYTNSMAISPDRSRIAYRSRRQLRIMDVASRRTVHSMPFDPGWTTTRLAFSPDNRLLVLRGNGEGSRLTTILDLSRNFRMKYQLIHAKWEKGPVDGPQTSFSPDGKTMALDSGSNVVLIDSKTGDHLHIFEHEDGVVGFEFSPDGKWLAAGTAGDGRDLWIWNTATRQLKHRIPLKTRLLPTIAFAPDSKRIATNMGANNIVVWDVESAEQLLSLNVRTGAVKALAFTRDGQRLLSLNPTLRVWDAEQGHEILNIKVNGSTLTALPNGTSLLVHKQLIGDPDRWIMPDQKIDLMKRFDPDRDMAHGECQVNDDGIDVSTGRPLTKLMFPIQPLGDYRLTAEFDCSNTSRGEVVFVLPAGKGRAQLRIDAKLLAAQKKHTLEANVKFESGKVNIDAKLNGKWFRTQSDHESDMEANGMWEVTDPRSIGFTRHHVHVKLRKMDLVMRSGRAWVLR